VLSFPSFFRGVVLVGRTGPGCVGIEAGFFVETISPREECVLYGLRGSTLTAAEVVLYRVGD